jgi:RNA polymerase primary sigma factor
MEFSMPQELPPRARPGLGPLDPYLHDIDETPLLTADEERELAWRIEDGDSEARDHLVRANLRLVVNLARHYAGRGLCMEDLIAEGNLGLLRAAEGYDPSMETRFSTYAAYWVKQSMRRALTTKAGSVHLPAYMATMLSKWRRASTELREELKREPTPEEVAAKLGLSPKRLKVIQKAMRIHGVVREEGGPALAGLAGGDAPDSRMSSAEEMSQVLGLVAGMEKREAAVLRMRFGLDGEQPRTLQEIGDQLGLTRERVRQIEAEALRNLRERLEAA